jgi:hypothetical protein
MNKRMKTKHKILIVLGIIVICLVAFGYFSNNYTVTGIDKYNEEINSNPDFMNFSLDEIGSYKDIYFQSTKTGGFLFSSYGSLIVADYDDDTFEKQLAVVNNLQYQTEPILFEDSSCYILPETEFQINDWDFKILENKSSNYTMPKDIDFIAVNKSSNQIAYLTFYDQDLDYLCKAKDKNGYMVRFVKKYFNYKF